MDKKRSDKWMVFLIVICFMLALALVALALGFLDLQGRYEETREQWEKKEKEYGQRLDALEGQEDAGNEDIDNEDADNKDTDNGDTGIEVPGRTVGYRENLDGLEPGDVVSPKELDMADVSKYFTGYQILEGDAVYQRINGKSYRENPDISLDDLTYLKMAHYDYEGQIRVGEMIVNKAVEADVRAIFQELFENRYQVKSMYLVDDYWTGDGIDSDSASIDDDNTSAFNYRKSTANDNLSNHAYGRAIDINPLENPYIVLDENGNPVYPYSEDPYLDRNSGQEHMISHDDLCYQVFIKYGFTWGGDWTNPVDYQHFEKIG